MNYFLNNYVTDNGKTKIRLCSKDTKIDQIIIVIIIVIIIIIIIIIVIFIRYLLIA